MALYQQFIWLCFQSLQMHMMTAEAFPFPILGLVHIRNQIKQTRPIGVTENSLCHVNLGN